MHPSKAPGNSRNPGILCCRACHVGRRARFAVPRDFHHGPCSQRRNACLLVGLLIVSAVAFAVPTVAFAQSGAAPRRSQTIEVPPPGVTQQVELRDGTRAYGRVERVAADRVTFRTLSGGLLELERAQVVSLEIIEGRNVEGEFWKADPNPTRLFFTPTGRTLRRGEAYFGVYEIVLPFAQVGVTDRFSIGGGTPLIFNNGGDRPFWITPKLQVVDTGRTGAAVGVMHMAGIDDYSVGIAYGVVTHGSPDSAITVGGGYAYARDAEGGAPVVMIGGEHRVHRNFKLITENYAFDGGGIASAGIRFMGERLSADLGMAAPLGIGEVFLFPMVNFVWKF
jgi:hypothetical protein